MNEEIWVQEAIRPQLWENIHPHSPLVGEASLADRWTTFDLACHRALLDAPGMCPHLSANHVTASGKHALRLNPNRVCGGVCSPRPLCYDLHSVALCECRGECFGSESDGWLNVKGRGKRNRRCLCEKESSMIRIFLSNLCEVFQGLGSYINCCWELLEWVCLESILLSDNVTMTKEVIHYNTGRSFCPLQTYYPTCLENINCHTNHLLQISSQSCWVSFIQH